MLQLHECILLYVCIYTFDVIMGRNFPCYAQITSMKSCASEYM